MDGILAAHAALERKGNLSKAISDVQVLIEQLQQARDGVTESPERTALHIAKLKQPVKASFDKIEEDLKEVNKGLNQCQKALKDKFKTAHLPSAGEDGGALGNDSGLVNRAIAMHMLREGQFDVADTFVEEIKHRAITVDQDVCFEAGLVVGQQSWIRDFQRPPETAEEDDLLQRGWLKRKFAEMYNVLDSLNNRHELGPAISWASENSKELENRGSNLEFELTRLKFVELYASQENPLDGAVRALDYAQSALPRFGSRYLQETSGLLGSLAYFSAISNSPYSSLFHDESTYANVSATFTREFCGMLGLSEASPLYTAVKAGGISLPVLEKVERIMTQSRGQWTSVNELPFETPLPPGMQYHSIFVCPVSKEQATDANPPMLLPCSHVIARDSLDQHSRGKSRMKCPYCPSESQPKDAKRVYI